jgi:hypothetical protein
MKEGLEEGCGLWKEGYVKNTFGFVKPNVQA